jgi:hypothetical protein
VGASRSHLYRRSRSARRRIEVKRRGRGGRREEDQERATGGGQPIPIPRALRLVRIEWRPRNANARSPKQAQPSGALCSPPHTYRPCLPALATAAACRLQLPRPRAPRGTVEWLSPSRARRTRASHMGTAHGGRRARTAVCHFALVRLREFTISFRCGTLRRGLGSSCGHQPTRDQSTLPGRMRDRSPGPSIRRRRHMCHRANLVMLHAFSVWFHVAGRVDRDGNASYPLFLMKNSSIRAVPYIAKLKWADRTGL